MSKTITLTKAEVEIIMHWVSVTDSEYGLGGKKARELSYRIRALYPVPLKHEYVFKSSRKKEE